MAPNTKEFFSNVMRKLTPSFQSSINRRLTPAPLSGLVYNPWKFTPSLGDVAYASGKRRG